jgi:hypothetical protein
MTSVNHQGDRNTWQGAHLCSRSHLLIFFLTFPSLVARLLHPHCVGAKGAASRGACVVKAIAAPASTHKHPSPIILDGQVLHSISHERLELVKSMEQFVTDQVGKGSLAEEENSLSRSNACGLLTCHVG